jgi:hypothetical protein
LGKVFFFSLFFNLIFLTRDWLCMFGYS